jgi:hypothetical protein
MKFAIIFAFGAFFFLMSVLIAIGEMEPYGSKAHIIADSALQGGIISGVLVVAAVLIKALWDAINGALKPSAANHGPHKAAFMSNLSDVQIMIIVTSIVILAAVLALIFVRFGYVYEYKDCLRLLILYDRPGLSLYDDEWGLLVACVN